jgi:hypothetical protein
MRVVRCVVTGHGEPGQVAQFNRPLTNMLLTTPLWYTDEAPADTGGTHDEALTATNGAAAELTGISLYTNFTRRLCHHERRGLGDHVDAEHHACRHVASSGMRKTKHD